MSRMALFLFFFFKEGSISEGRVRTLLGASQTQLLGR